MVRAIIRDENFLGCKSEVATIDDLQVAVDLLDTLKANANGCVGMAANMIGVKKCIIAFSDNGKYVVMFNPKITYFSGVYETEEGCLSLSGTRKTKRYKFINVEFQNNDLLMRGKTFKDFSAQIIQHEIDHCNGILI